MLIGCVILYMMATVAVGIYASSRVKDSKDFMVAGRSLPLYMNFACVFATWFGAETVLSVSAKFAHKGLGFVSGDPFGASMCLILVAFFFARTFYRLELLTIGDYYHLRYGKFVEIITSLGIASSYLGWTSAQLSALGLVTNVLFPGLTLNQAILIGAAIVTVYTLFGGMWSVALTDVVQTAAIVIGLILVAFLLGQKAGGFGTVITAAQAEGKLTLFPHVTTSAWLIFIGEFITMSLGSIPQQDVFQRVTSAKNEKTAFIGTLCGGLFYFAFAFVPMFIAYSATVIDISYAEHFQSDDAREVQKILPTLILKDTPIWTQVLFFGAVLSAILSTASGTVLAPASVITENVLQPAIKHLSDSSKLWVLRAVLILVAIVSTTISVNSESTMYEMVESGYSVTLVVAFVPLVFGIYWSRATTQGAIVAILLAVPVWIGAEYLLAEQPLRIAIFADTSKDMDAPKMEQQKEFVERALKTLGKSGEFQLVRTGGEWFVSSTSPEDQKSIAVQASAPVPADKDNSARALAFLKQRSPASERDLDRQLETAFKDAAPDAELIVILGNGAVPGKMASEGRRIHFVCLDPAVASPDGTILGIGGEQTPQVVAGKLLNEIAEFQEARKPLLHCVPPQLYGLIAALLGMLIGSLMPQVLKHIQIDPAVLANRQGTAMGH